ncbi:hypothetical protein BU17DRAFT_103448 [Hysterangium stoloniferum]|nr:hypothetical protein BU17DRAFT_103448 [Hysterangium stoloniferum]
MEDRRRKTLTVEAKEAGGDRIAEVIGIEESPLERNDEMSARDRLAIRIRELSKSGIGGGDDGDGDDDSGGSVAGKNLTPKVREVGLIRR